LSTPWSWRVIRFGLSSCAKHKIYNMISTNVMISAGNHLRFTTCHMPHTTDQPLLGKRKLPDTSRCMASTIQQISGSTL
jgi:hypothetical protein